MSNKSNTPFALKIISWSFPKIEFLFPSFAKKLAVNLFFKPFRFPFKEEETLKLTEARQSKFTFNGEKLQMYRWGSGPKIILLHGWAGRVGQFREFIDPLVDMGFEVIAFDAPAHGNSTGHHTDIMEFSDALRQVAGMCGPIKAVIAHSIGGAATIHALQNGLQTERVVFISIPTIPQLILDSYQKRINASDKSIQHIVDHIGRKYDITFDSIFPGAILPHLPLFPALIIHDHNDREVSISHAKELESLLPNAEAYETTQLGHTRILRDRTVIQKSVDFIAA